MIVAASAEGIRLCVDALRKGRLVALPTETVYGLAADATNDDAIRRVFAVKGRPPSHPLIVHVASTSAACKLLDEPRDLIERYARRFWPGPLTVLGRARSDVSRVATGQRDTVAVRIPAHVATLRVLEELGRPVAMPSANRFGRVSPTTATHVDDDLGGDVDLILDGGPCELGLESTILDVSGDEPRVLRPGPIPARELGSVAASAHDTSGSAPGTLAGHYAPRRPLHIVHSRTEAASLMCDGDDILDASGDPAHVARHLYDRLRCLDTTGGGRIIAVVPSGEGLEWAIRDRLIRAATPIG